MIKEYPTGKASISTIESHIKKCIDLDFKPDLILIDYVDLLRSKRKNRERKEEIDDIYIKTASVLAAYVDQSISTNTFYNPAHFAERKVPITLIAKNLMQAHYWGLKTFYYSLINKQGSRMQEDQPKLNGYHEIEFNGTEVADLEDCEACKL